MSVQKLRICKKDEPFTTILNNVIQNLKNYEALGLYAYLLSLPDGWIFHKKHLSEHTKIGRDKINKLLKILHSHNLIDFVQARCANGAFAQLDLHIKDGRDFKINDLEKPCAPFTEKPLTDNQLLVNSTYKRNINKRNINKENIKSICASDDAQKSFEKFWNLYPRKKNKQRALKLWIQKRCAEKDQLILDKLALQILHDADWKNIKYIPHPVTYLNNERWEDEITPHNNHYSSTSSKFNPLVQGINNILNSSKAN